MHHICCCSVSFRCMSVGIQRLHKTLHPMACFVPFIIDLIVFATHWIPSPNHCTSHVECMYPWCPCSAFFGEIVTQKSSHVLFAQCLIKVHWSPCRPGRSFPSPFHMSIVSLRPSAVSTGTPCQCARSFLDPFY